jgi:hypothetical protein
VAKLAAPDFGDDGEDGEGAAVEVKEEDVVKLNARLGARAAGEKAKLNQTDLRQLFESCQALANANKINTKNAFGVHLIDYMEDVLQMDADGDDKETNFLRARSVTVILARCLITRARLSQRCLLA